MSIFSSNKKPSSDDVLTLHCDKPGCQEEGLYRAPQDRSLNAYYRFCLNHIREYNKSWNYYTGLDMDEIARLNAADIGWQRPTWPLGHNGGSSTYEHLRNAADQFINADGYYQRHWPHLNADTIKALKLLDVATPYTQKTIKKAYKTLVKQYHPDNNNGSKEAQEKIISINEAYQLLKNNPHIPD